MKKLNITRKHYMESSYFQRKYGKLEYVSESGKLFKTDKGKVLKFNESSYESLQEFYDWLKRNTELDSGITVKYNDNEDGSETLKMIFDDRYQWADDVVDGIKSKDEDDGIMEWLRVFQRKTTKNHWSLDIDEDDATDEYIITVKKPASKEDMYAETSDEGRWSEYGEFLGQLPMDCILGCSHGGRCDDDVEFWVNELNFADGLPVEKAKCYLQEYGAWDEEELENMSDDDVAQRVLWIFCGNIKDEAYEFMRDGDNQDWPDLEDWDEKDWRRFQEEQCYLGLNN